VLDSEAQSVLARMAHFLKANRGVMWVGLKQLEFLVGKSAHLQPLVSFVRGFGTPNPRRGAAEFAFHV
jgi:hypothetical protein